ncbi:MAG: hypothetical protein R3F20_13970 [Planctomycetota bacterium]
MGFLASPRFRRIAGHCIVLLIVSLCPCCVSELERVNEDRNDVEQAARIRRDSYLADHKGLSADVRLAINMGSVILGMTERDVEASLGEPVVKGMRASSRCRPVWWYARWTVVFSPLEDSQHVRVESVYLDESDVPSGEVLFIGDDPTEIVDKNFREVEFN